MSAGTVYLIHFSRPLAHARHYVGWTSSLDERMESHRKGHGAKLMAAVAAAGIEWSVVRTWEGDRNLERQIKNRHGSPKLCPVCRKGTRSHD